MHRTNLTFPSKMQLSTGGESQLFRSEMMLTLLSRLKICTQALEASSSMPLGKVALPRLGRCLVTTLNSFFKKKKKATLASQEKVMFLILHLARGLLLFNDKARIK